MAHIAAHLNVVIMQVDSVALDKIISSLSPPTSWVKVFIMKVPQDAKLIYCNFIFTTDDVINTRMRMG